MVGKKGAANELSKSWKEVEKDLGGLVEGKII